MGRVAPKEGYSFSLLAQGLSPGVGRVAPKEGYFYCLLCAIGKSDLLARFFARSAFCCLLCAIGKSRLLARSASWREGLLRAKRFFARFLLFTVRDWEIAPTTGWKRGSLRYCVVYGVRDSSSQGSLLAFYANKSALTTSKASFALRILSHFELVTTQCEASRSAGKAQRAGKGKII